MREMQKKAKYVVFRRMFWLFQKNVTIAILVKSVLHFCNYFKLKIVDTSNFVKINHIKFLF